MFQQEVTITAPNGLHTRPAAQFVKEAKGDNFGTYGIDRYNRAIKNISKLQNWRTRDE
jgi:phosphotransferase system HPr-like phosphotransfer protein